MYSYYIDKHMEFFFEMIIKLLFAGLAGLLATFLFVVFLYRKHRIEVELGHKKARLEKAK